VTYKILHKLCQFNSFNSTKNSSLLRLKILENMLRKICKHYQLTQGGMGDSNEAEGYRGLAQHGVPPGWLEGSDRQVLFCT
jgi:hypothetical protein